MPRACHQHTRWANGHLWTLSVELGLDCQSPTWTILTTSFPLSHPCFYPKIGTSFSSSQSERQVVKLFSWWWCDLYELLQLFLLFERGLKTDNKRLNLLSVHVLNFHVLNFRLLDRCGFGPCRFSCHCDFFYFRESVQVASRSIFDVPQHLEWTGTLAQCLWQLSTYCQQELEYIFLDSLLKDLLPSWTASRNISRSLLPKLVSKDRLPRLCSWVLLAIGLKGRAFWAFRLTYLL